MRLSVASNYDPALVEGLVRYPVEEVYGKLPSDCLGGGRATYMLARLTRKQLRAHVARVRQRGMRFNYLLNAACWDSRETTRSGQRELRRLLDWIVSIGVEAVTVSIPSVLALVKACYPQLKTRVSVFACVDSVQKARYWEDTGADCICLDSLLVNRELRLLKAIRKRIACDLQLLVNNSCLQSCSLAHAHMTHLAHASQKDHPSGGFLLDWCHLRCTSMKLEDPIHYIRADWIRPEDLQVYEEMGYENFKIVERNAPTEVLLARVRAYSERRYDGNLLDLVQPYAYPTSLRDLSGPQSEGGGSEEEEPPHWRQAKPTSWRAMQSMREGVSTFWRIKFFLRPGKLGLVRALQLKRLAEARGFLSEGRQASPVYVDNRLLDGFIERFKQNGCREVDCESCGHCRRYAQRAVRIEPAFRKRCSALYNELFRDMATGSFYGYRG